MTICSRRGDRGETRLFSGEAISKDHPRVMTYGTLDELQSLIGVARAFCGAKDVAAAMKEIQMDLFAVSSELATIGTEQQLKRYIDGEDVARLEERIDRTVEAYGMPSGFVVPGAGADSAAVHVARTVCRRCERLMVTLFRQKGGRDVLLSYINRLGDLLFMLAWSLEVRSVVKNALAEAIREQGGGF